MSLKFFVAPAPALPRAPRRFEPLALLRPNRIVAPSALALVAVAEAVGLLALWIASPYQVLPTPVEVLGALQILWLTQGLGRELVTSLALNLEALALASAFSLGLAYLTVFPVCRPLVAALSKGRFLSLTGFSLLFTLAFGGGHALKLALLTFAVTVFYVTSMADVISQIPRAAFDHARTLRMSEARVTWEVVILGTAAQAFDVLRQNAAMGWMMLTLVEGIVRGEGGIGALLLNENKHFLIAQVFAIQLVILSVGLLQDCALGALRRLVCPYADLTLER